MWTDLAFKEREEDYEKLSKYRHFYSELESKCVEKYLILQAL